LIGEDENENFICTFFQIFILQKYKNCVIMDKNYYNFLISSKWSLISFCNFELLLDLLLFDFFLDKFNE